MKVEREGTQRMGFASCLSTVRAGALTGARRQLLPMFVEGATPAGT
jgi:hypothetical protein